MSQQPLSAFLRVLLTVLAVLGAYAGLVWLNLLFLADVPGGTSLFSAWYALKAFMASYSASIANPYAASTASEAQAAFGGQVVFPRLDLPFYLLMLQFPFAAIKDFALARAAWSALAEIAIAVLAFFNLRVTQWRIRPVVLALYLVFMFFSVLTVLPILAGDSSVWLALLITLALWALRSGNDELAGALLVLTTFRWQVSGFFLIFVLVWLWSQKRERVLIGFGMTLILLGVASFVIWPGWYMPFLQATSGNLRAGVWDTPASLLAKAWPGIGVGIGRILTIALLGLLTVEWAAARQKGFRHFLWAACLTLAVSPLIGLPAAPTDYTVLALPLTLFLAIGSERWMRAVGGGLILVGLLVGMWAIVWRAAAGPGSGAVALFFMPPLVAMVGLYWVRWWAVRAPIVRPGSVLDEDL